MNISDWQAALSGAEIAPKGFTTADIAKSLGLSRRTAREMLQRARDRGTVIHVGFRTEADLTGTPHRIPVYQFKKKGA